MEGGRVLVVLSGCGNRDGSEIHESTAALIALDEAGLEAVCTAPRVAQKKTVSHITGGDLPGRNAFEESARIARGKVKPLESIKASDYDAVLFPGGMGAALTLCTYAQDGPSCSVLPGIEELVHSAHGAGKPIAAMCIAPMILARLLPGVLLTLGRECEAAEHARAMGARHRECGALDAVVDASMKVVTTPAYMVAEGPSEVLSGARRMVEELRKLMA
ncbi:isoprenoid biosynthesis glyoxalase ElbB [Candidatus Fermentibacteria bacterium]|nr:isoprenoid biosynthesis glyoxalase ElbB [Candidatus Fermentibacteria bacterium]